MRRKRVNRAYFGCRSFENDLPRVLNRRTFNLSVEIHCVLILIMHVENVTAIFLCLFYVIKDRNLN